MTRECMIYLLNINILPVLWRSFNVCKLQATEGASFSKDNVIEMSCLARNLAIAFILLYSISFLLQYEIEFNKQLDTFDW